MVGIRKESYTESLTDLLLATLGSARNVRRFRSILFERKLKRYKKESVQVALSRLRVKGYIEKSEKGWCIAMKGKKRAEEKYLLSYIVSPFKKDSPQNTIISFDVPVHSNILRNWLRNQIKIFGYKMLQQSLWVGPGPLPYQFMKRLEDLKIRKNVKTFKISKIKN